MPLEREVFTSIKEIRKALDEGENKKNALQTYHNTITEIFDVLGFKLEISEEEIPDEVIKLADERAISRAGKDWIKSDELRDKIKEI